MGKFKRRNRKKENELYGKYVRLIKRICWSWHRTTGIEFDTLNSEANIVYVECLKSYNPERGKFSTFLWHAIQSKFKNLVVLSQRNRYDGVEVELEEVANSGGQYQRTAFNEIIENLSKEAKEIVSVVLNAPADLLEMIPTPRASKHQLEKYLIKNKQWKSLTISYLFAEIKDALK